MQKISQCFCNASFNTICNSIPDYVLNREIEQWHLEDNLKFPISSPNKENKRTSPQAIVLFLEKMASVFQKLNFVEKLNKLGPKKGADEIKEVICISAVS